MDWIDVTLIVLGLAGCGVLHLMASRLVYLISVIFRLHLEHARRIGVEFRRAACTAKVIGSALVFGIAGATACCDVHVTDRIMHRLTGRLLYRIISNFLVGHGVLLLS